MICSKSFRLLTEVNNELSLIWWAIFNKLSQLGSGKNSISRVFYNDKKQLINLTKDLQQNQIQIRENFIQLSEFGLVSSHVKLNETKRSFTAVMHKLTWEICHRCGDESNVDVLCIHKSVILLKVIDNSVDYPENGMNPVGWKTFSNVTNKNQQMQKRRQTKQNWRERKAKSAKLLLRAHLRVQYSW